MTDITKLLEREVLPVDTTEPVSSEQVEIVDQAQDVFKKLVEWITQDPQNDAWDIPTTLH